MNWIDCILFALMGLALFGGWSRGFIIGSVDLLVLLGSLAIAITAYPYVEQLFNSLLQTSNIWTRPLAFLAILLLMRLVLWYLFDRLLRQVSYSTQNARLNKLMGLLPGLVNGLIYCAILSALFLAIPLHQKITNQTRESQVAPRLALQMEWLEEKLAPVFSDAVNRTINKVTVAPRSEAFIDLDFKVDDVRARPDLERQMLTLINAERMKRKLRALVFDPALVPVARAHSADMFARGYFSHQTPEGLSPADRVKKAKVRYLVMGENLALGQTLSICHRGLMNSPGHRANILNTAYGRVGIGIVDGGVHGLMVTQEFRN